MATHVPFMEWGTPPHPWNGSDPWNGEDLGGVSSERRTVAHLI